MSSSFLEVAPDYTQWLSSASDVVAGINTVYDAVVALPSVSLDPQGSQSGDDTVNDAFHDWYSVLSQIFVFYGEMADLQKGSASDANIDYHDHDYPLYSGQVASAINNVQVAYYNFIAAYYDKLGCAPISERNGWAQTPATYWTSIYSDYTDPNNYNTGTLNILSWPSVDTCNGGNLSISTIGLSTAGADATATSSAPVSVTESANISSSATGAATGSSPVSASVPVGPSGSSNVSSTASASGNVSISATATGLPTSEGGEGAAVTVTSEVTEFTTYCPGPTTFAVGNSTITFTGATTITVPCHGGCHVKPVTETSIVTEFTTFCPEPTTFTYGSSTYTVTAPTTITIPAATSAPAEVPTTPNQIAPANGAVRAGVVGAGAIFAMLL